MKIHTPAVLLLGAAALTVGLGLGLTPADPVVEAVPVTASREATNFNIDPVHSTGLFRIHHLKAGMFYGRFNSVTGTFTYDADDPAAIAFDVSIDVESIDTGTEGLDTHLKSPDFFNAKEHAKMTFKSTSVSAVDDDTYEVTGTLTIRGTTKTITTNVDFTGMHEGRRGTRAGFETIFTVDRTEFGVNYMADSGMLGRVVRLLVSLEGIEE